MKKKIVIGLSIFSLIFLVGGIYIIATIETATSKLDNLIKLHQVEILREQLLIQIRRVQSDLSLKNTRYARSIDTIIANVKDMENVAENCFECHHSNDVLKRLTDLRNGIEKYKDSLSRVFTIRANARRLEKEEDSAFKTGEQLVAKVNNMINMASIKLENKTRTSLRDIADTKIILYILIGLGPVSTVFLSIFLIKGFTKPVNTLLDATRKLKEGNLDYKIEGLKDEFGEVAESFNEMAGSLKEQMIKMQRTEQMVLAGELAAGLAHEIKNPLTGVKLSVEVLLENTNISEEERAAIFKAVEEIERINSLTKSLLNFAKPPKPQLAAVDINDLLDRTISFSLKHPILASNTSMSISVSRCFDKKLPKIMVDPMQLQQVFLNLLLNAIEALQDGGELGVRTSHNTEENTVEIEISNTGKGIDPKVIDKIFQPFFTTKSKGTGLGLAITKRLIEQHNGKIWVKSKPGGGAVFYVSLPVTPF